MTLGNNNNNNNNDLIYKASVCRDTTVALADSSSRADYLGVIVWRNRKVFSLDLKTVNELLSKM